MSRRFLIIEPYYGGSHKQFLDELEKNTEFCFQFMTLPARKWKMRMQLSAYWFAEQFENISEKKDFDGVLCSTFVDVCILKNLFLKIKGWDRETPFFLYFHENQFGYPHQQNDESLYQFRSINFNSALCADKIGFNSVFNRDSFFHGCRGLIKKATDMKLSDNIFDEIKKKSSVLYPGIDYSLIDEAGSRELTSVPVIVWNHRWEHDKNPELFFSVLKSLKEKGLVFKLIIMGQSFKRQPSCFSEMQIHFKDELIHFGYVESKNEYAKLLKRSDIIVSTARHEFFGISVLEAVRAGCRPLLPDALSYPELFPPEFLYKKNELEKKLSHLIVKSNKLDTKKAKQLTEKYSWNLKKNSYEKWLLEN